MTLNIKKNITTINQWHDRSGYKIKGIVMHSMAGTQRGTISWFRNPQSKVSAHYCISDTGDVVLTVEEKSAAWHAGQVTVNKDKAPTLLQDNWGINPNLITLGIEMEDKGNRNHKYTPEQYSAAVILVADICQRYDIPMDRGHVFMHRESDPINKSDPLGQWDHEQFIKDVVTYGEKGGVKETEEKLYPYRTKVKVLDWVDILYVRSGASKIYPLAGSKKLKRNNEVEVVGFVKGERLEYNEINTQFWWKSAKGNYFWAGGTNIIPNLDDFLEKKDNNLKENIMKEQLQENFNALATRQDELVKELENVRKEMASIQAEINTVVEEPVAEEPAVEEPVVEEVAEIVEPTTETPNAELVEQVKTISSVLEELKGKLGLK